MARRFAPCRSRAGARSSRRRPPPTASSYSYADPRAPAGREVRVDPQGRGDGRGPLIDWSGKFAAKGAPDAKAKEVIDGIYQAGLTSLRQVKLKHSDPAGGTAVCGGGGALASVMMRLAPLRPSPARPWGRSFSSRARRTCRVRAQGHHLRPEAAATCRRPAQAPRAEARPVSAFRYLNGTLHADAVPLEAIAAAVGTPCYVYSATAMRERAAAFRDAFAAERALLCYAVKANSNLAVIRLFAERGPWCRHRFRRRDRAGPEGRGAAPAHRLCRHRQDRR